MAVPIDKLPTGIQGFDLISQGGLPRGRATLISGTSGSAKTVFASQFLASGIIQYGEPGVFVTFEEPAHDIRRNMASFGWSISDWEQRNLWKFVDASPDPTTSLQVIGEYDLEALLARITYAVQAVGARRLVLDSMGGIFTQLGDHAVVRRELFRILATLKGLGLTAIFTAERTLEEGPISRYGMEEFVADNVVILRNELLGETRRRTIEILKFRGTSHQKGSWPFTIDECEGIIVIPLSALELKQHSSDTRVTSGNAELDRMCGGGFFRDSIILISGPTGTGKTLLCTEFLGGGAASGERCLMFAFEESRDQLTRNARGWGVDMDLMESQGLLEIVCAYPESAALEDHLIAMKRRIEQFEPHRVVIDSLSALERVAPVRSIREFVIGLVSFIKSRKIPGLFTNTTSKLSGGESISETHVSTITDSIIVLRYVETFGQMRRSLAVLKMRGSNHDKEIRECTISHDGMHIGHSFRNIQGILSGNATIVGSSEIDRLDQLFPDVGHRSSTPAGP